MNTQPLFVAEIGMNHDGDWDRALEMIRRAKWAGADIAKFQFGWRDKPGDINEIGLERARRLQHCCEENGIEMMASILTEQALDLARQLRMPRYKIASRSVVDNPALCWRILSDGKPTYVSLGMWEGAGFPFGPPDGQRLFYLYCRSKYPASFEDLAGFPERFEESGYYGYSDHCLSLAACFLAISRGALMIEKHFTFNKASTVIRDHALSATPEEFRFLTEQGRELARLTCPTRRAEVTG